MRRFDRGDDAPGSTQAESRPLAAEPEAEHDRQQPAAEPERETALGILLRMSACWIR